MDYHNRSSRLSIMTTKSGNTPWRTGINAILLMSIVAITLGAIYLTYYDEIEAPIFFIRSINDASYECEDKIAAHFGSELLSSQFDQYSSRYESNEEQYLIYYRVSTQKLDKNNRSTVHNHMAKCTVWETLGIVSSFQVFDDF